MDRDLAMSGKEQYANMQQDKYNALAEFDSGGGLEITGFAKQFLTAHNNNPDYEYLWKDIPNWKEKDVLDFGCGPGRNLVKYHDRFRSIDGVDIAEKNLEMARRWLARENLNPYNFKLYKNNGVDIREVPTQSYNIVMSTICLQHISAHETRFGLLQEFYRVLRPGGYVTFQMLFTSEKPGTVKYYDNQWDVNDTNGAADCLVENPEYVKSDLEKIGFTNFHYYLCPANGGHRSKMEDWEWIFVNAQK